MNYTCAARTREEADRPEKVSWCGRARLCGACRLVSAPGELLRTHPICGVRPRPLFSAAAAEAEAASAAKRSAISSVAKTKMVENEVFLNPRSNTKLIL